MKTRSCGHSVDHPGQACPVCHEAVGVRLLPGRTPRKSNVFQVRPRGEHGPCVHLGEATGQSVPCASCNNGASLKLFECDCHGTCTIDPKRQSSGVADCGNCSDYWPAAWSVPGVTRMLRFDESNLAGVPGWRFNASITEFGSGYLLAFRTATAGSEIGLVRLGRDFRAIAAPMLLRDLHHADAQTGREDPRLFWFRGKLHLSYIGVVGVGQRTRTNVLYARLGEDLSIEAVFSPHYSGRRSWEKNWAFFEHEGELFAAYSITPHQVLHIDGEYATLVGDTLTSNPWKDGEMRGGAPPVRVGDEYWCFFHDRIEEDRHRIYRTGLYTFDARPPFRMRRIAPEPLIVAHRPSKPATQYASVVFTCGAVRREDRWVLSSGIHDRWTELHTVTHAELESRLVDVSPPRWFSWREGTTDGPMFSSVLGYDEYRLRDLDLTGGVVVDIGGHIGGFVLAARQRGAAVVHSYEPESENLKLLRANVEGMAGVEVFPEAIGDGSRGVLQRMPTEPNHTGAFQFIHDSKGHPSVRLAEVVRRAAAVSPSGRVALLKIDCEGGEWWALSSTAPEELTCVERIIGEYHAAGKAVAVGWPGAGPETIREQLNRLGYVVGVHPASDGGGGLFWALRATGL